MSPITRARVFQYVELGEDGAGDAGGSRASAYVLFRNALREARDLARPGVARPDDVLLTRADAAALIPVLQGAQLLLVAPNLVTVERQLRVDPHDFRLWVCLHEVTHRVQFTAVPWLREHMGSLLREYLEAMQALWTQEEASYDGELVSFGPSWAWPKPLQQPRIPVLIGAGGTEKTFAWIARSADGDILFIDPEQYWNGISELFRTRGDDPHPWRGRSRGVT